MTWLLRSRRSWHPLGKRRTTPTHSIASRFLEDTSRDLAELQEVIATADLGPPENLVGPLADARPSWPNGSGTLPWMPPSTK